MNGYERIRAAIEGRRPDHTPVMLHNFLMAAREAGVGMRAYREDPGAIARCFVESVERYGYDGIVLDVDTATLAAACGVPVHYPDDAPARCRGARLDTLEKSRDLEPPDIAGHPRVQVWLEAARLLSAHFGDEVFLRGNCDQAPYSLAALVRGPEDWMLDLLDTHKHEGAHRLLTWCAEACCDFIRLMARTGVHMVSNGDSLASPDLVSPRFHREFALAYERRIALTAHDCGLPYVLHVCGKTDRILEGLAASGADGLELDYKTGVHLAREAFADRAAFIGNLDPSGLLTAGSPGEVTNATLSLRRVFAGTPRFILNAGCAIPADAPGANIRAMIAAARTPLEDL
jgi:uroporphyrinogen decarboxylase